MRRFLLISIGGFSFFVLLIIGIGLSLDNTFQAGAETEIDATPEQVYEYVSDMDNWHKWSGWTDDQQQQIEISREGPKRGEGATVRWEAENSVGRLTITRAEKNEGIWYEVAMEDDRIVANGSVTIDVKDGKTIVTLEDEGELPPVIGGYFREYQNEQITAVHKGALKRLKQELEKSTPVEAE
ncbi:SRPBCC family protein [Planctomycetota bacterium]|nr:SRPBCC family protein [Planctomycetota bacterium]